jgi:hypothetical protein
MDDLDAVAKNLKEKTMQRKTGESAEATKERMKKVLEERDKAMKKIYDYQDKTGIPTKEETEKDFFDKEINK